MNRLPIRTPMMHPATLAYPTEAQFAKILGEYGRQHGTVARLGLDEQHRGHVLDEHRPRGLGGERDHWAGASATGSAGTSAAGGSAGALGSAALIPATLTIARTTVAISASTSGGSTSPAYSW